MPLNQRWLKVLDELRSQGRYRSLHPPQGLDFTSNDYLGYGTGSSDTTQSLADPSNNQQKIASPDAEISSRWSGIASRLLRGHHVLWEEVEEMLASWHGAEAALVMTSGFSANEGLIATIAEPGDWVAVDELCHACVYEGLRVARPRKFLFRHNDLNHLEEGLRAEHAKRPADREMFVVTESLFSMDGDKAPLCSLADLCERYHANLIVDEAHTTGCFGLTGSGCVDAAELRSRVLATVHTGGKALGLTGAYICGTRLLKELLVNRCRHLIFTTALPPAIAQWWLHRIPDIQQNQFRRRQLHANATYFRRALTRQNIVAGGEHYIVPVVIGEDAEAVRVAQQLQQFGYDIRAIRPPTVPANTSRLRISIHADHQPDVLDALADTLARVLNKGI